MTATAPRGRPRKTPEPPLGARLIAAFDEALADLAAGNPPDSREIPTLDVAAIRHALGLTQQAFADRFGFAVGAVRDWEQRRKPPGRTAQILLRIVARHPEVVAEAVG